MPRLHSSVWLGSVMILFAAALAALVIPDWVITPENVAILVLSPDFWPYIIAGLLALGGVALLLQYWFVTRAVVAAEDAEEPAPPGGIMRILLVAILMALYYVVMHYIGMVWSSVIAYMAYMGIIGLPRKAMATAIAILLPIALYAFFAHVAGVPIPQADFLQLP